MFALLRDLRHLRRSLDIKATVKEREAHQDSLLVH